MTFPQLAFQQLLDAESTHELLQKTVRLSEAECNAIIMKPGLLVCNYWIEHACKTLLTACDMAAGPRIWQSWRRPIPSCRRLGAYATATDGG